MVVAQTAEYLTSIDGINKDLEEVGVEAIEADGEITAALTADAEVQAKRLSTLESEINGLQKQLDAQFEDMKNIKYQLAAVFFHRGSYGHGHYWIYIHDFVNNVWRIYNDERVEEFTKLESIFEAKTWDQGTPTYAVYVAEDKMDYVQTVFRDLEPAPDPPVTEEWKEFGSTNAKSQQDSVTTVDPKVLTRPMVTEGGTASWDDVERQVPDMSGGGNMGW
jgi:ubiquitin carboxyl-terminal hydrolase 25/28